ncbi:hypothetical protein ACTA71_003985 [Dictyostelium dimigraforme]
MDNNKRIKDYYDFLDLSPSLKECINEKDVLDLGCEGNTIEHYIELQVVKEAHQNYQNNNNKKEVVKEVNQNNQNNQNNNNKKEIQNSFYLDIFDGKGNLFYTTEKVNKIKKEITKNFLNKKELQRARFSLKTRELWFDYLESDSIRIPYSFAQYVFCAIPHVHEFFNKNKSQLNGILDTKIIKDYIEFLTKIARLLKPFIDSIDFPTSVEPLL